MRRLPLLLAFGATLLLGGCDWWGSKPPPAPVVTCNCQPPIRGPIAAPPPQAEQQVGSTYRARYRHTAHYRHRSHYGTGSRRYAYSAHQAEGSVDIYGYSSSSHVAHGYGAHGDCCEGERYRGETRVWADGYGRRHIYDQSAVAHYSYEARQRHRDEATRLDPWHGYDDYWGW